MLKGRNGEAISDLVGLLAIAVSFAFSPRLVAWLVIVLVAVWLAWRRLRPASASAIVTPENHPIPDVMAGAQTDPLADVIEELKAQQEQIKSLAETLSALAAPPTPPTPQPEIAEQPETVVEPKPRQALPRRMRLRTQVQREAPAEAPAQPPFQVRLIPIRAQLTTYQEGHPPKHSETLVRLSGRG